MTKNVGLNKDVGGTQRCSCCHESEHRHLTHLEGVRPTWPAVPELHPTWKKPFETS